MPCSGSSHGQLASIASAERRRSFRLLRRAVMRRRTTLPTGFTRAGTCGTRVAVLHATCAAAAIDPTGIVSHADNGGPMKGATLLATLERLGVLGSFSRPGVSNDQPHSEALFPTDSTVRISRATRLPISPAPRRGWRPWWPGTTTRISTAPSASSRRRSGTPVRTRPLLAQRDRVYAAAKARHPAHWSGPTRDWSPITTVHLNPQDGAVRELRPCQQIGQLS